MKTMMTKMKALAIAGMTMGLAIDAQAETIKDVKYIDANGIEQTYPEATLVTKDTDTIEGWYVVTGTVECAGITVSGAAHLILADGCSLTVTSSSGAGIKVSGVGNSLAIYGQSLGTGTLTVNGGSNAAGIGGNDGSSGSNITINGGTVTAEGGSCGAGIGGGYCYSGSNITINGGSVTATGGSGAAGIGGGNSGSGMGITINGGSVTATGGSCAEGIGAGIGGGYGSGNTQRIYVNPLMLLKAGASAPSTEVATNRTMTTDVATDLANKQYATAKIDYMLYLQDGEAHAGYPDDENNITARAASMGLAYAGDNVWAMSNFVFRTTNGQGARLQNSNLTFVVIGANSILCGGGSYSESYAIVTDRDGTFTIKGGGAGDNALTLTVLDNKKDNGSCEALCLRCAALSVGDNVTINAISGYGASDSQGVCAARISVFGTSKVIAKADTRSKCAEAIYSGYSVADEEPDVPPAFEPDATAVDAVTGAPLTWVWEWQREREYEGTYANIVGGVTNIATYAILTAPVPPTPIPSKVTEVANTTYAVYTNGVLSADGTVLSNKAATVVYTAKSGYAFSDGSTVVTNQLDTKVNPAVNKAGEVPSEPAQPTVQLGIVAQRYPWNGTLDVGYRATYVKNTAATLTVVANGKEYPFDVMISAGTNSVAVTLPAEIKAKNAKVTLKLK